MSRRILIVDDHPLVRDALKSVLVGSFADFVFETAGDFTEAEELLSKMDFDLVLLDLKLPGTDGLSALIALRANSPSTPIIVVSHMEDSDTVQNAIRCGASGFIPKSTPRELINQAVEHVISGNIYVPPQYSLPGSEKSASATTLTQRQNAVLELMIKGSSNKQIAYDLDISEWTVKSHVAAIFKALNVRNRVEAVLAAKQL